MEFCFQIWFNCNLRKTYFLCHSSNKAHFVFIVKKRLEQTACCVIYTTGDADRARFLWSQRDFPQRRQPFFTTVTEYIIKSRIGYGGSMFLLKNGVDLSQKIFSCLEQWIKNLLLIYCWRWLVIIAQLKIPCYDVDAEKVVTIIAYVVSVKWMDARETTDYSSGK